MMIIFKKILNTMKKKYSILKILFAVALLLTSCEKYLDRTPASNISEADVFKTYPAFQGYVDGLYAFLVPYLGKGFTATIDCGDDVYSNSPNQQVSGFVPMGNYMQVWSNAQNPFRTGSSVNEIQYGFWEGGWLGIHNANLGLKNFDMLVSATDEEKNLLLGQMYFFRAWCHFEIVRAWGSVPYIDKLLEPDDNMNIPRLSLEETFLKIAADFGRAAKLLPWDWDETVQGKAAPGKNWGRITQGIALAIKARTYLYAASPWIEGLKNGTENKYNLALCDSAASAALEVINSNRYQLVPWNQYQNNFARNDNSGNNFIWTPEIIFSPTFVNSSYANYGLNAVSKNTGRVYFSKRTVAGSSANGVVTSPTLNFVNLYETANGLAIGDDPTYNPNNPWVNRDPRFLKTILIDGVKWSNKVPPMTIELFSEGGIGGGAGLDMSPNSGGSISGFLIRKYTCFGVNGDDKNWTTYAVNVPYIRLPEMYLTYAEAVNEIGGSKATLSGSSLTPLEAVNIVRRRVKLPVAENIKMPFELQTYGTVSLPDVNAKYAGSKETFRERIRNERSVELAFEGHRWYDIRRWYVAHHPEYKQALGLAFSKPHTNFRSFVIVNRLFENPKHYLLPFQTTDVNLYKDFTQNPGW
jgi:hypothetical protein